MVRDQELRKQKRHKNRQKAEETVENTTIEMRLAIRKEGGDLICSRV